MNRLDARNEPHDMSDADIVLAGRDGCLERQSGARRPERLRRLEFIEQPDRKLTESDERFSKRN